MHEKACVPGRKAAPSKPLYSHMRIIASLFPLPSILAAMSSCMYHSLSFILCPDTDLGPAHRLIRRLECMVQESKKKRRVGGDVGPQNKALVFAGGFHCGGWIHPRNFLKTAFFSRVYILWLKYLKDRCLGMTVTQLILSQTQQHLVHHESQNFQYWIPVRNIRGLHSCQFMQLW